MSCAIIVLFLQVKEVQKVEQNFIPLFVKICYVQTGKKTRPNHFIGAASSNKVRASINNLLFCPGNSSL